jgi:hypothetical protein
LSITKLAYSFDVTSTSGESLTVAPEDRAAILAPARPGEPDPVENVAPKLSTRLLQAHGADADRVKGHGEAA